MCIDSEKINGMSLRLKFSKNSSFPVEAERTLSPLRESGKGRHKALSIGSSSTGS